MQLQRFFLVLLGGLAASCLPAQEGYRSPDQMATAIRQLQRQYSDWLEVTSLTKTAGGQDIWVLTLGSGNTDEHPGIVVAGGVDGAHLAGSELALGVAEFLLEGTDTDSIRQLLSETTFYVFPQLSPDAARQYFASLRYERSLNARETDNDRDGYTAEDPFDDLNKDGLVTMMRIADPTGDWRLHPADERVLVKAKKEAGEVGSYRYLSEGVDNDRDGAFNEDDHGGVAFNQNLTFNYNAFQPNSGDFPVSEPESRAVLDFLFNHWNVFAVFTFGPSDNLAAPMTYKPANQNGRKISGILEKDEGVNKMLSSLYGEFVKIPKDAKTVLHDGGFLEWAYFHYGRFSVGAPGWRVPQWEMPKDSLEKQQFKANEDNNPEVNFLRWAADNGLKNYFVPWTVVDHPDFPDQRVEVGGIAPFLQTNPPYAALDALVEKHSRFVIALVQKRPKIELVKVRTERLDDDLWRVKATVFNAGEMPTTSAVGDRLKWVKRLRVDFKTAEGQKLISGQRVTLFQGLPGGGSEELTWLVQGKGTLHIEAGAPHCGRDEERLELR